ncbi:sterol desaturase family protein [Alteromonas confluentis]|nr:sterol desaturase family protein [Alteromonas confluentis]
MFEFIHMNGNELLNYLFDANKRIFWLYLLFALIFATFLFFQLDKLRELANFTSAYYDADRMAGKPRWRRFIHFLLPRRILKSKSAWHDVGLLFLNKLIKAAIFPVVIITMVPVAIGFSNAIEYVFGAHAPIVMPDVAVVCVFTVLLFIADDFSRFLLHWLLHRVPVLWEFHKVHHSAEVLTPFTIYRSHPVESYLYGCRMALTQGMVVGLCYYLFGPTLTMFDIAGANVFVFAFNVMGSNLRHSHIWWSWGNKVEKWFISPAQHQIHHSSNPKHFGVNLGSALAVWDRLFNTLIYSSTVKSLQIGIGKEYEEHKSLTGIYLNPFKCAFRRVIHFRAPEKVPESSRQLPLGEPESTEVSSGPSV